MWSCRRRVRALLWALGFSLWGAAGSVLISALAFALYHFEPLWDWGAFVASFRASHFAFYILAGVYFAAIYVMRGFGIVAATHALYDIMVESFKAGGHHS